MTDAMLHQRIVELIDGRQRIIDHHRERAAAFKELAQQLTHAAHAALEDHAYAPEKLQAALDAAAELGITPKS